MLIPFISRDPPSSLTLGYYIAGLSALTLGCTMDIFQ